MDSLPVKRSAVLKLKSAEHKRKRVTLSLYSIQDRWYVREDDLATAKLALCRSKTCSCGGLALLANDPPIPGSGEQLRFGRVGIPGFIRVYAVLSQNQLIEYFERQRRAAAFCNLPPARGPFYV